MTTNYPGALDSFTNPQATDKVATVSHAAQHANANDAIEALEAKVGIDGSGNTDSHDYKLSGITGSDKAASDAALDAHTADTANPHVVTKSQVGLGNVDNTSDATKNAASATLTNKTIDADNNTISNLETDNFKANVIDTDVDMAADSDTRIPTQKAVKAFVEANAGGTNFIAIGSSYADIDGSATPVAVAVHPVDGTLYVAEADDTRKDDFIGFVFEDVQHLTRAVVAGEGNVEGTNPSGSVQMKAGSNKLLVAFMMNAGSSGNPAEPSGITWNGQALTKRQVQASADRRSCTAWYLVVGDLAVDTTATLTVSGATAPGFNVGTVQWFDITNADQSNPIADSANASDPTITALTPNQAIHLVLTAASADQTITLPSGYTSALALTTGGWNRSAGYAYVSGVGDFTVAWSWTATTDEESAAVVIKNAGSATDCNIVVGGILAGFSGLTPNAKYYLSNTAGAISTSPGSTSILIGKAISATEIVIIQA